MPCSFKALPFVIGLKRSRKYMTNLKLRPSGEVAAQADGEGLFVETGIPDCPNRTTAGASSVFGLE